MSSFITYLSVKCNKTLKALVAVIYLSVLLYFTPKDLLTVDIPLKFNTFNE